MLSKKILASFTASLAMFIFPSVFANGVLHEDQETVCDFVEKLVDENPNSHGVFQYFEESRSGQILFKDAFLYSVKLNKTDLVKKFLKVLPQLRIDINDDIGYWPGQLAYDAVLNNNEELYNILIDNGYIIPKEEYYIQKYATTSDKGEYEEFEQYNRYPTVLHAAVEAQNLKLVKRFLKEEFDPNAQNGYDYNCTPLHTALDMIEITCSDHKWGNIDNEKFKEKIKNLKEIIEILIKYGADTNIVAGKNMDTTALAMAQSSDLNVDANEYARYLSKEKIQFCKDNYEKIINVLLGN